MIVFYKMFDNNILQYKKKRFYIQNRYNIYYKCQEQPILDPTIGRLSHDKYSSLLCYMPTVVAVGCSHIAPTNTIAHRSFIQHNKPLVRLTSGINSL